MSRWKSPQVAARLAEHAAKKAAKARREKRYARLMLIGFVLIMVSLMVADYFWLRAQARKRQEQHQKTHHRPNQTDTPVIPMTNAENTDSTKIP